MSAPRRGFNRQLVAWLASAALPGVAAPALTPPPQGLRIIVVYPPGGASDAMARLLAQKLALGLGMPVHVDNRAGGGGSVGLQALVAARPDGLTLAFSALSPLTLRPHLQPVPYDVFRDVAPVAAVMMTPLLLAATPAFSGKSLADVLLQAQARPGALRWATSGYATAGHLLLEQVEAAARIRVTHAPYKGGAQQLTDALSGQFELLSTNVAALQLQYVQTGQLKALAVAAPARLGVLPQVPTFAELGLPQATATSLFGLFAPGRTPPAVLDQLHAAIHQVLLQPDIRSRLLETDNLPILEGRADFVRRVAQDWDSNRQLKHAGMRLQ